MPSKTRYTPCSFEMMSVHLHRVWSTDKGPLAGRAACAWILERSPSRCGFRVRAYCSWSEEEERTKAEEGKVAVVVIAMAERRKEQRRL